jgi:dTDP-4-dehydrorhamnose reductase
LKKTGLYHIAGSEYIDRYHFALKLAHVFNFDSKLVKPIKTPELKQKAPRPLNSSFNIEKATHELGIKMKDVEEGLMMLKQQLKAKLIIE